MFATSLRELPGVLLGCIACAWLAGIAAGALALRRGPMILTVIASLTKTATVVLVVLLILAVMLRDHQLAAAAATFG